MYFRSTEATTNLQANLATYSANYIHVAGGFKLAPIVWGDKYSVL
jgi:hypothetical protein